MLKIALIVLEIVMGLAVFGELSLRWIFGFGNPPTYIADTQIGYLLAPNQRTRRFGKRIEVNAYSMRSPSISRIPSPSTLRVLLLGDSIANGGWWTDQDETISVAIAHAFRSLEGNGFSPSPIEVLNASANSWGPRNELAYLQKFGHFNSQAVVLLLNTDDLFATAPTSLPVGRDRNYPDRPPLCAWAEAFGRYLLPETTIPELEDLKQEGGDRVGKNLAAIADMQERLQGDRIPFLVAMTPLRREIGLPGPKDYEIEARQRLLEFTKFRQLPYIDFLPTFNAAPKPQTLYRDTIHLTPQGNQLVSEEISQILKKLWFRTALLSIRENQVA